MTPLVLEAIRRHKSVQLKDLASELGVTVESVSADAGGLHDYGYVTRMGSGPDSWVRWEGPDDGYVLSCLATVETRVSAVPPEEA